MNSTPFSAGSASLEPRLMQNSPKVKERSRISNACDNCKSRKIRCTGKQPCEPCLKIQVSCHFSAPSVRGRKRKASLSSCRTQNQIDSSGGAISAIRHNHNEVPGMEDVPPSSLTSEQIPGTVTQQGGTISASLSPEPFVNDRQGHFVGPASGLSFLLRLQRRLRRSVNLPPETSIFTLGDAPLPPFDETSFTLPEKSEALTLVARYFELSSATYRFLHRATVDGWLEQLYGVGRITEEASRSKYAVLLTVFAQATRYVPSKEEAEANTGVQYFQAAERQLNAETEPAHLTSVQALLGQCFYILTYSRLNHCWSLFGTASRLAHALGLHRKRPRQDSTVNYVEAECKKRVFWVAYNLDKYLSAIMGRPCVFHDEDIDQEMPSLVDDKDLFVGSLNATSKTTYCTMLAPNNHTKLVRTVSRTLRELYGIRPLQEKVRYRIMEELGEEVETWRKELPAFLNPDQVDARLLTSLFQRQNNMLSLAYGHALILIFRPCLFNDFKQKSTLKVNEGQVNANVRHCLTGAMTIATVVNQMVECDKFYPTSWFTHYQTFCAVVVLYTYTIRVRSEDQATWIEYFRTAERCQTLISSIAAPDSLAHRFCVIMEEYRLEVIRQIEHHSDKSILLTENTDRTHVGFEFMQPTPESSDGTLMWTNGVYENGISPSAMELPNWEQLGSLAFDFGGMFPNLNMYP